MEENNNVLSNVTKGNQKHARLMLTNAQEKKVGNIFNNALGDNSLSSFLISAEKTFSDLLNDIAILDDFKCTVKQYREIASKIEEVRHMVKSGLLSDENITELKDRIKVLEMDNCVMKEQLDQCEMSNVLLTKEIQLIQQNQLEACNKIRELEQIVESMNLKLKELSAKPVTESDDKKVIEKDKEAVINNDKEEDFEIISNRKSIKALNNALVNEVQKNREDGIEKFLKLGANDFLRAGRSAAHVGNEKYIMKFMEMFIEGGGEREKYMSECFSSAAKSGNLRSMCFIGNNADLGPIDLEKAVTIGIEKNYTNVLFVVDFFKKTKKWDPEITLSRINIRLVSAAQQGSIKEIEECLRLGANQLDKALFCACVTSRLDNAMYLIEKGARGIENHLVSCIKSCSTALVKHIVENYDVDCTEAFIEADKRSTGNMRQIIEESLEKRRKKFNKK